MSPRDHSIALKVQAERRARGWTQSQLAQRAGVKQMTISRWESGENTPRLPGIQRLAAAFEKPVTYFTDDTPTVKPARSLGTHRRLDRVQDQARVLAETTSEEGPQWETLEATIDMLIRQAKRSRAKGET
jgi:transcriptional regulator with XRE-family HTH domain